MYPFWTRLHFWKFFIKQYEYLIAFFCGFLTEGNTIVFIHEALVLNENHSTSLGEEFTKKAIRLFVTALCKIS